MKKKRLDMYCADNAIEKVHLQLFLLLVTSCVKMYGTPFDNETALA